MADSPPGSGIPIIGTVLQALANIFGTTADVQGLAQQTARTEQNAWSNAISMATWAYGAFGDVANFAGGLLDGLKNFLGHLFKDLIFGHIWKLLQAIWKQLTDKHSWLNRMIGWLKQLQKMQRQSQLQAVKKVIDLIQRIRKVLVIFRLFHLKFAQKLDSFLAGIEGKLIGGVFNLARKTNEIALWTDVVLDPKGGLRSGTLWWALNRDAAAAIGAANAIGLGKLFPGLTQIFGGGAIGRGTFAGTRTALRTELTTNSGNYGDYRVGAKLSFAELESEAKP